MIAMILIAGVGILALLGIPAYVIIKGTKE
jgi:hypothetical protein